MESKIKRRSSIKRVNRDEQDATAMANQKRISFSGRKSVREFHKEEEPKTWNNSYDISDPTSAVDGQGNSLSVAPSTAFELRLPHNLISTSKKVESPILSNSALCTTMEFIDKSRKIEVLQVEHSLDITLLQTEHRQKPQSQQLENLGAAVGKVATEGEVAMNTSAETLLVDSATGPDRDVDMVDYRQQTLLFHEDKINILKDGITKTELCSTLYNVRPLHHVTTYMDETIEPDRESCDDLKDLGRRTVQLAQDMDVSDDNNIEFQQNDKENMQPPQIASPPPSSSKKANSIAKVVVTRKICTPNAIPNNSNLTAVEMRRLQRYQKHFDKSNMTKKSESVLPLVVPDSRNDGGGDFEFLSPELDSSLFSSEFVGSQCRQIKESFSAKTVLGASSTMATKEAKDVSPIGTCDTDKKSKTQEIVLEIKPGKANTSTATKKYKHRALKFSEVDDMLLDNTSFLTHAKLGDETTSRNNSKCSNNNRRVPMHFNNTIETLYGTRAGSMQLASETINESALKNDLRFMNSKQRSTFQRDDVHDEDSCADHEDPGAILDDELISAELITNSKRNSQTDCKSMPIIAVKNEPVKEVNYRQRRTLYWNSDIEVDGDLTRIFDVPASTITPSPLAFEEQKPLHFITNKDMTLDESMLFTAGLDCTTIQPKIQLRSAELIPNEVAGRPPLEDSLYLELEKTRASVCKSNISETRKNGHNGDLKNQFNESPPVSAEPVVPTTPHRSIIEFEYLERAANIEQQQCDQDMETNESKRVFDVFGVQRLDSVKNMEGTKRITSTLTPNLPLSKKRATLVFEDCNMDESIPEKHRRQTVLFTTDTAIEHECADNAVPVDDTSCCEIRAHQSPSSGTENNTCIAMEMTAAVHEKSLRFPLLKDTKESPLSPPAFVSHSRIPLPVGIGKRSMPFSAHASPRTEDHFFTNHSLETIEIARRVTSGAQRKESLLPLPIDVDIVEDSVKEMKDELEDNPITISDVSTHFLAHRKNIQMDIEQANHHRTEDDGSDDNLGKNTPVLENFKKDFMILTRDNSLLHIADMDDIDKTTLSLVETMSLLDADDENSNSRVKQQMNHVDNPDRLVICDALTLGDSKILNTRVEKHTQQLEVTGTPADCASATELQAQKGMHTTMCRKCKRCQETILDETANSISAADSFVLPTENMLLAKDFERMKHLRQQPNMGDATEYWRRMSLERSMWLTNFNAEPEMSTELELGDDDSNMDEEHLIRDYQKKAERYEEEIIVELGAMTHLARQTFVQELDHLLQDVASLKTNWIFDYQMQARKLFRFTHKQIATFCIDLLYEEKDAFGYQITVEQVRLQSSRYPKKNWKPFDFLLDFQLRLELPFNLKALCVTSDAVGVFEMLENIDRIIVSVCKMGYSLWQVVCSEQASLIRDSDRTFVRKVERHISAPFLRVEHSEFRIELLNARKVCFSDIASPPLHSFHERVQFLPVGLDFLRIFLRCPTEYLKTTNPDSTD